MIPDAPFKTIDLNDATSGLDIWHISCCAYLIALGRDRSFPTLSLLEMPRSIQRDSNKRLFFTEPHPGVSLTSVPETLRMKNRDKTASKSPDRSKARHRSVEEPEAHEKPQRDSQGRREAGERLRKAYDDLEQCVAERTAEIARANDRLQQEINVRKEAQEALQQSYETLLTVLDSIDGQATEILERGCDGFIQKPFSLGSLSHKIREVLDELQTP